MKYSNRSAFTLAEMMIVMLILTILLAAFAPLMTKKKTVDLSSPWRWAANNSDIYYGVANNQTAIIGKNSKDASDPNAKLIINQSQNAPFMTFKFPGESKIANLYLNNNNISLGAATTIGGNNNIALGYAGSEGAVLGSNSGSYNIALGNGTLAQNTSASENIAIGWHSLRANTTGHDNIAIGDHVARYNLTGSNNIGLGEYALSAGARENADATGSSNIAIGQYALTYTTEGSNNIAIGNSAGINLKTGSNNIAIGNNACSNVTTGSNKICIGNGSGPSSANDASTNDKKIIYLGDANTAVYIPGRLIVGGASILGLTGSESNYMALSYNGAITRYRIYADTGDNVGYGSSNLQEQDSWYQTEVGKLLDTGLLSDLRLKNVGDEFNNGLDKIRELKVFHYTFKKDKDKTPHVGVMAQDLQKIFPDAVTTGDDGYLRIRMEDMFYAAINAIKELDKMLQDVVLQVKTIATQVAEHDTQIQALQKENADLKAEIKELENQNKDFENRLKAIEKKMSK